jgi:hypothetical protein
MNFTKLIVLSAFSLTLLTAQANQPGKVINIPVGRGIYFDDPTGLVPLPGTTLSPYHQTSALEYFNLGHAKKVVEVDGASAALAIPTPRPTFYINGYQAGTRIYLVHATEKQDYREVRMEDTHHFSDWASFAKKDLTPLDLVSIAPGLITAKPRTDLAPGEYLIVSDLDRNFRMLQLCWEFRVQQP